MKTKHTPAPWIVSQHEDNQDVVIRDNDGAIIANLSCDSFRDYGQTEDEHKEIEQANAYLIAAAPELLDALESITETLHQLRRDNTISGMLMVAEMAIAKVKG